VKSLTSDRQKATNFALLVLAITCSFLAVQSYDYYPKEPYDKSLDPYRLFAPGVIYSCFIVFLQRGALTIPKMVLYFLVLSVLYYVSFLASFASWGAGVPFAGGIGSFLIRQLFYPKSEFLDSTGTKYLLSGFLSGLVGLYLYHYSHNDKLWTNGVGFGFILITWQIVFGLLWIRQVERDRFKKTASVSIP